MNRATKEGHVTNMATKECRGPRLLLPLLERA